jgi:hypothetical protein
VTEVISRFLAGLAGGLVIGLAVFRGHVFQPGNPAFECLTIGALLAGILALARQSRRGQALALALSFAGLRFVLSPVVQLSDALSGLLLGLGLWVVALIFDLLARGGWRFGKFLLVGPLAGGVFLALAPITELQQLNVLNASSVLMFRLALGMLIGEGVALGVELADLSLAWAARTASSAGRAVPGAGAERSDGERG